MKKLVIIPGGFHPFHAGHKALYDAARVAFPAADVYIAATADTSTRPFPFDVKKKLARIAGIDSHRFIQVKSPFRAEEITQHYDPANTQLIFVRSDKDKQSQPLPGGTKKDGNTGYLQPYKRNGAEPMSKHGYIAYLPTVQFGPGMTSATEIRAKWPTMSPEQKISLVHALYPDTTQKTELGSVIVRMLDAVIGSKPTTEVDEATMKNDPESGPIIYPDGGMGGYAPDTLQTAVARHMMDTINFLKAGEFDKVDYMLYQWGVIENKVKALKQYYDFMKTQGRRPIAKGREVDLAPGIKEVQDYIDEAGQQ